MIKKLLILIFALSGLLMYLTAFAKQPVKEIKSKQQIKKISRVAKDKEKTKMKVEQNESDKIYTTASGLKYIDEILGNGSSPKLGQKVKVHYTGWLENGKKFDSSVDRGEPFEFVIGVGQVIKGWDEGVSTMKIGGKRKLIIPSGLGYGARGAGNLIPPNATLVFDVELLGLN